MDKEEKLAASVGLSLLFSVIPAWFFGLVIGGIFDVTAPQAERIIAVHVLTALALALLASWAAYENGVTVLGAVVLAVVGSGCCPIAIFVGLLVTSELHKAISFVHANSGGTLGPAALVFVALFPFAATRLGRWPMSQRSWAVVLLSLIGVFAGAFGLVAVAVNRFW